MKKILLLANRDFVLYNFRFELIKKLLDIGYEVFICLPYGPKVDIMVDAGAEFIPINIDSRGKNPIKDIVLMKKIKNIFSKYRPDVILMYTTKACIYGGIVAGKMHIPYLLNVSGLGTAMGEKNLFQSFMISLYKLAVRQANCVFFQNDNNIQFFHDNKIICRKEKLIPGSGVNVDYWNYIEYPNEDNGIHFLFIARIIKQKGIEEYVQMATEIKKRHTDVYFHILGPCDGDYKDLLEKYENERIIQYHGMVQDTREYLKLAHCTIHPSYYPEGISNVCLESASVGRPIITTNNPGCMETIEDGKTGYIVEQKNVQDLINKVELFLNLSFDEKKTMGINARKKVSEDFNRNIIVEEYMREIEDGCK